MNTWKIVMQYLFSSFVKPNNQDNYSKFIATNHNINKKEILDYNLTDFFINKKIKYIYKILYFYAGKIKIRPIKLYFIYFTFFHLFTIISNSAVLEFIRQNADLQQTVTK